MKNRLPFSKKPFRPYWPGGTCWAALRPEPARPPRSPCPFCSVWRLRQHLRAGAPSERCILTPTRELALQIDESFAAYGRHMRLAHCVIFGGVNQNPQVARLKKGVDILTATPGRLNDLIGQGYIDLKNVEIFVLDEADRMLDMGFVHDVKRVLACLPGQKQTLLFSATMPAGDRGAGRRPAPRPGKGDGRAARHDGGAH